MCGIGGILRTDGEPIPDQWLDAIDARIAYRGPDGEGRFRDRVEVDTPDGKKVVEVAFVHRRLSIIDHEDGAQPMVSERGRTDEEGLVAVVFNGCIYNHRELRKELEAAGHTFVTDHSDTEVLIHGWREWGVKLNRRLEGMYAFAIWDRSTADLMLARDSFGEKPLWYNTMPVHEGAPDTTAFASAPGPILGLQLDKLGASKQIHWWVDSYLRSGTSDTAACSIDFQLVLEHPPGDAFVKPARDRDRWDESSVSPRNGGNLSREARCAGGDEIGVETLIDQAVARRLEADVPLGCFLSGGVDSSLISCFAKKHKADLRTFSVKMSDPRYDESHHAEQVAAHLGTDHVTLECDPHPAEDLVFLIETLGQPFGDSSILPTYWVSKAAREHVKVAISGDGGDELFVGYERYMAARTLARHHWWLRCLPVGFMKRFHPKSRLHKLGRLVDMARDYPRLGIATMESIFSRRDISDLVTSPSPDSLRSPPSPWGRGEDPLAALRLWDINHYLPGDLLRKVDTASMTCALEVRCPFLDRDLASAVLAMPIDDLIPGGKRKGLLRKIARKYLPREVVDRPKMGFAIPVGEWFRSDYGGMKTLLMDHLTSAEPFGPISLNRKEVQRFIDEHMSGRRDHSLRLFTLLTLSIWGRSVSC